MTGQSRTRALLIGNWKYTDPEKKLLPLRGPGPNLEVMRAALTHEDWGLCTEREVTVHENLSGQQIGVALLELTKNAGPDAALVIYYTGHGERLSDQQLAFCGVDAEYSTLEATSFDSQNLRRWLRVYNRARSTVILLDCCYAGQYMGSADLASTVTEPFGAGTAVLTSGGNELVPDAESEDQATRYTAKLAAVLCNPEIPGSGGFLTVDDAYQALVRLQPKLTPEPWRDVAGTGSIPLARRSGPEGDEEPAEPVLRGWRSEQSFSTVEVAFERDRVIATWGDSRESVPLDRFDRTRQAAVRRLSQLADAVVRADPAGVDADTAYAVRRAWECVGANLFETTFPAALQEHLRSHTGTNLGSAGDEVIRLRLRFGEGADFLGQYPWEYLQLPPRAPADPGRRTIAAPLALHAGLVVERSYSGGTPDGDQAAGRGRRPTVGVVNALPHPYSLAGRRVAEELKGLADHKKIDFASDLHGEEARWDSFIDCLDNFDFHYVVLYLPVRRNEGDAQVGFHQEPVPDWLDPRRLAGELSRKGSIRAVVLVTVAATPGRDSFRGLVQFATELSRDLRRPLFFVCHQPGFERYVLNLRGARPQTMWGLMLDALTRDHDLHRSFWYARDQFDRRVGQEFKSAFGVPGCFLPDDRDPGGPAPGAGRTRSAHEARPSAAKR